MRQVLLSRERAVAGRHPGAIAELDEPPSSVHARVRHGGQPGEREHDGRCSPSFLVKDVPGPSAPGAESFETEQPRIYYGESFDANEYSIVNSDQEELDYPTEEEADGTTYATATTVRAASRSGTSSDGWLSLSEKAIRTWSSRV